MCERFVLFYRAQKNGFGWSSFAYFNCQIITCFIFFKAIEHVKIVIPLPYDMNTFAVFMTYKDNFAKQVIYMKYG